MRGFLLFLLIFLGLLIGFFLISFVSFKVVDSGFLMGVMRFYNSIAGDILIIGGSGIGIIYFFRRAWLEHKRSRLNKGE